MKNEFLEKLNLSSPESTSAIITALNTDGLNGIVNWKNMVLGLDPKDSTSKPIVKTIQNQDSGKVKFALGNVEFDNACGIPAKYRVKAYGNAACSGDAAATSAYVQPDGNAELDLPASGDKVKYYKVEIEFAE